MYRIEFTLEAIEDLRLLRKYDQQRVVTAIESQLAYQPTQTTRNRKQLRPNPQAAWELRAGVFRVFYTADPTSAVVKIVAIGYEQGSTLFIHGKEYTL